MPSDWFEIFAFSVPPLELFVRGSAIYLFLLIAFRTILKRDLGAIGVADVLLLVVVADAAQNAMAGEYHSIGDGLVLVSTILGWNLLFDYLAFRFAPMRHLLEPRPMALVREGRILARNLRREFISEEELRSKLREHGISDLADVRSACIESDGSISVIRRPKNNGNGDDVMSEGDGDSGRSNRPR
jgi:uncharacterized membrane protein YcaP (DUF421 family)